MKVDRVLVPLDGSPFSEIALPTAIEALSDRPGATLILMRATDTSSRAGSDMSDAQVVAMSEAQSYLRTVAERLREAGLSRIITTCVWYSGAAHAIVEAARRRRANLIVMSRHFRSSVGHMSDGAIAESVARRAPTPVVLVHPQPTRSESVRRKTA
jgi:nucleotide-binding universal stress UspA family protein